MTMYAKWLYLFGIIACFALTAISPVRAQPGPAAAAQSGSRQGSDAVLGAPQQIPPQTAPTGELGTGGQEYPTLRTIGGLAIVICLICAGVIGGKKFLPQYFTRHRGDKQLKLLETLSMGDKRSVALIQVDDKSFLVGNTPQQITLLANISSPLTLSTTPELALQIQPTSTALKANGDNFRSLYEVEKKQSLHGKAKAIPPDVRAKMRQLREALEH